MLWQKVLLAFKGFKALLGPGSKVLLAFKGFKALLGPGSNSTVVNEGNLFSLVALQRRNDTLPFLSCERYVVSPGLLL